MPWEQQSPINLTPDFSAKVPASYLRRSWSALEGIMHQGTHGIEVLFRVNESAFIELNGKRFHLRNLHFHHPSEHLLLNGMHSAELHIVHQNLDDLTYAVIGVILEIDEKTNDAAVTTQFKLASEPHASVEIDPEWWLPEDKRSFFRYEGSLTTEPFTESVSWLVCQKTRLVSRELLSAIFGKTPQHARPLCARSRRFVIDLKIG